MLFAVSTENLKNLKYEDGKILKEEWSIEILIILGLTENVSLLQKYGWRKHKERI